MRNYISIVYDLTKFGIYKIKNAMVTADMDDGITMEVSFDGGSTFIPVELNKKFKVTRSKGKIQVKIKFLDSTKADIYKVNAYGFFQNLDIGTTLNFTKISTKETYTTKVGENGRYAISLPRGVYEVWYVTNQGKIVLMNNFNPEVRISPNTSLDKENSIELFLMELDWAKYSVFDTFYDHSKMLNGSAIVDPDGNLSDGITDRKVRYWAIGFE